VLRFAEGKSTKLFSGLDPLFRALMAQRNPTSWQVVSSASKPW